MLIPVVIITVIIRYGSLLTKTTRLSTTLNSLICLTKQNIQRRIINLVVPIYLTVLKSSSTSK